MLTISPSHFFPPKSLYRLGMGDIELKTIGLHDIFLHHACFRSTCQMARYPRCGVHVNTSTISSKSGKEELYRLCVMDDPTNTALLQEPSFLHAGGVPAY